MRHVLPALILATALAGCGGGGDAAAAPPTGSRTVTFYHASGRIAETGAIDNASGQRTGEWTAFHDADGSPRLFVGTYVAGAIDRARPWREWNADGSIRADGDDR